MSSVTRDEQLVELTYGKLEVGRRAELERLVSAEQGCCGAAGVEFAIRCEGTICHVVVRKVRNGLPAETVLAAFAGMGDSLASNE
ncbi:MAG: hypothetical protein GKR90_22955 [Pseudomonadales bacterium]|nr:hypothetical protein [Pseudomonadales bacterium]